MSFILIFALNFGLNVDKLWKDHIQSSINTEN